MDLPDYDPRLPTPPLTDAELEQLDAALLALPAEAAMNVEAVDGYLTALLLGPGLLPRLKSTQWMPVVWGADPAAAAAGTPGPDPWPSGKQRKRVAQWLLRHLHAIDRALQTAPEAWEPVFSVAEADPAAGDDDEAPAELADAEDWCAGFLQAVALDEAAWAPLFDDAALAPLWAPLVTLGGDEAALPPAMRKRLADPAERDRLSRAVPALALALQAQRAAR